MHHHVVERIVYLNHLSLRNTNPKLNKTLNNVSISKEEIKSLVVASLGSGWIRLHPESVDIPENSTFQQMKPGLSQNAMNNLVMSLRK